MLRILLLVFLFFPNIEEAHVSHSFKKLKLPIGSESLAFDSDNLGPYTGLNDGRIVKYAGPTAGFLDFATTSPNRSKELCDGTGGDDPKTAALCGRPVGLEFDRNTGELYIADASRGLMVVESGGGTAVSLAGGPVDATDAIAIDPVTGDVYFTDVGHIFFKTTNMTEILMSGDTGGRLLKYDRKMRRGTVVLRGLAVPNGAAVSADGSFVLVAEYIACRITRFWLKGPKAKTSDIFVELPGNPDNIKRTKKGDFWVAVNIQKIYPKLISFPLGQRISVDGEIVETINFYKEYTSTYITEVQEHDGALFLASVYIDFVGIYRGIECCKSKIIARIRESISSMFFRSTVVDDWQKLGEKTDKCGLSRLVRGNFAQVF